MVLSGIDSLGKRKKYPFCRPEGAARFIFILYRCFGRNEVTTQALFDERKLAAYVLGYTSSVVSQVYEPGGLLMDIRDRVKEFMGKHNEEFPAKKVKQSSVHLRMHYCMY